MVLFSYVADDVGVFVLFADGAGDMYLVCCVWFWVFMFVSGAGFAVGWICLLNCLGIACCGGCWFGLMCLLLDSVCFVGNGYRWVVCVGWVFVGCGFGGFRVFVWLGCLVYRLAGLCGFGLIID